MIINQIYKFGIAFPFLCNLLSVLVLDHPQATNNITTLYIVYSALWLFTQIVLVRKSNSSFLNLLANT